MLLICFLVHITACCMTDIIENLCLYIFFINFYCTIFKICDLKTLYFLKVRLSLRFSDHCGTNRNSAILDQNSNINNVIKVLKMCDRGELYSLE